VRAALKLLQTSTFRLAAVYLTVFAISVGAVLAYIYWNTAILLERQTEDTVEAEVQGLAEQYRFIPYFPSGVDFRCSEMWFLL